MPLLNAPQQPSVTQRAGSWLICLGVLGFVVAVIMNLPCAPLKCANGALPAVSLFFILLGMVFHFPELLQDESKGFSTMRVVVFMVISVFIIIAMKLGWQVTTFAEWKVEQTWVYILGLAFGSKVFQTFSEKVGLQVGATARERAVEGGEQPVTGLRTALDRRPKLIDFSQSAAFRTAAAALIPFKFSFVASGSFGVWAVECMGEDQTDHGARSGSFSGTMTPGLVLRVYCKVWDGNYSIAYSCEGPSGTVRAGATASPITGSTNGNGPDIITVDIQF